MRRREVNTLLVERFPCEDLLPGGLVVVVVDFYDLTHVLLLDVLLPPAPPAGTTAETHTYYYTYSSYVL